MNTPYELRSLADDKNQPRLFLLQLPLKTKYLDAGKEPRTLACLDGTALESALSALRPMLPALDNPSAANPLEQPSATLPLSEDEALPLALGFHAVGTLRSAKKIRTTLAEIHKLPISDVAFWLMKILGDEPDVDTHRKALALILKGK